MKLDRSNHVPLYVQLRSHLVQQVESGLLKPGDPVPTEMELMERYGVSRVTVRQAMGNLIDEGLLYRQQGIGTFVRRARIQQELGTLTGFSEEMVLRGLKPSTKLVSAEMVAADDLLSERLQIQTGEKVLRMVRIRLADGEPMALDISHCPNVIGERLLKEDLEQPLYTLFEEKIGIELERAQQIIESALADEFVAQHLCIQKGKPILRMERVAYSVDDLAVEYSKTFYRADRYSYRVSLKRKPKGIPR